MFLQLFNELLAATQLIIEVSIPFFVRLLILLFFFEDSFSYPFGDFVYYLLDYSFDYPVAYYPFMHSITHSTIQSITHLIIHSTIYSIIHSIIHSMIHSMGHRRNTERTPTGHQRDTVAEGLGDARSGARVPSV